MNKIGIISRSILMAIFLCISGCACVDPLEPVNRKIFCFNMFLDRSFLRPIAGIYDEAVPPVIACHIGNFFDNLDDITNIANNALQFKLLDAWSDAWRFAFNTTFGILGLFDVATCAGLPKHHQDFGLTLARYGFVNSTYLMIPFFGPSTLRDSIGWAVDWRYLSIWPYIEPAELRYSLYGLRLVHKRAALLPADKLIDEALDPYVFVRDAYLQKRACDIRSICPPSDEPLPGQAATQDPNDTFVSDGNDSSANGDDTFVPEGDEPTSKTDSDDTFVADDADSSSKKTEPVKSSSPVPKGDDTFVAP